MLADLYAWLIKNSEWLFGGIGATAAAAMFGLFAASLRRLWIGSNSQSSRDPLDAVKTPQQGSEDYDSPEGATPEQSKRSDKTNLKGKKLLHCSFCGKSEHEVEKLIAGPSVFICNQCTDLCIEITDNADGVDRLKAIDNISELSLKAANPSLEYFARIDLETEMKELALKVRSRVRARPGDKVAGAVLVRTLGSGNFATVWQGNILDKAGRQTGRTAAIKIFDQDKLAIGLMLWRFQRGIRAMQHLANLGPLLPSSIVKFYEVSNDSLSFSMQYLSGGDLQNLKQRGLTIERRLLLFQQVLTAVSFAHANHIIHRDIKPANIVLDEKGNAVLTDFDIADLRFTQTQSIYSGNLGTPQFAAPEQLGNESIRAEPTADIYSLGKLLYFLLLQEPPPMGSSEPDQIPSYLKNAFMPDKYKIAISIAIRYDPSLRFQSVQEFADACQSPQTGLETTGR